MLKLAHFRRHKRKTLKKLPGKTTNYPLHKPEEKQSPGKDVTKKISNVIDKTVNMAKSAKTKKVRFQYFSQFPFSSHLPTDNTKSPRLLGCRIHYS